MCVETGLGLKGRREAGRESGRREGYRDMRHGK